MSKQKQSRWQRLFLSCMIAFMLMGSIVTIGAMRVNPPTNLDQIVLGNVDVDLIELAVQTNNDTLITEAEFEQPRGFFEISSEGNGE